MGNKIQRIYIGTNQVRPYRFNPGANTIAYFPFKENQNDVMGTYSLDKTMTKGNIGYSFTQSGGNIHFTDGLQKSPKFGGIWFNVSTGTGTIGFLGCSKLGGIQYWIRNPTSSYNKKIHTYTGSNWSIQATLDWDITYNQWHYYAYSLVGTNLYVCRDGVVSTMLSSTPYDYGTDQALCNFGGSTSANIEVSERIIESDGWSSEKMTEYYNNTKSTYGL